MNVPKDPQALFKFMTEKNAMEVDQFPYREWESEVKQIQKGWEGYHENIMGQKEEITPSFNFRYNLIDSLKPFLNWKRERKSMFRGEEHEIKLDQLDTIPGNAKLVYRNHEKRHGTMVDVFVRSRDTLREDVESVAKELYKKVKKL